MKDIPEITPTAFLRLQLSAETVSTVPRFDALEADWRRLESNSKRAIFFQSFDWCGYIWRTRRARTDIPSADPRIIVVRNVSGVVAIWPLAIARSSGGRFAQDLTEPFGQYSDILLAPDVDIAAVMQLALAEIARWRVDGLVLRKVRADAAIAPWLKSRASPIGPVQQAPAVELSAFDGFDAYRRSLNSKTRKNLRNYRNRLGREGALSHSVLDSGPARAAVIERCFLERTGWLETSGQSSTAFADPMFKAVVTGLARGERQAPPVIAMRLALVQPDRTDADLSVHWGFIHQQRYYAFMAAKNPSFDDFSPGRLHLEDVIATCAGRGIGTVDLLLPAMPYKLTWSTVSVDVSGYGLALTAKGRLIIGGWHGMLRPALKAMLAALPPFIRKHAMHLMQTVPNRHDPDAGKSPAPAAASAPTSPRLATGLEPQNARHKPPEPRSDELDKAS